jgi:hypothetical protein
MRLIITMLIVVSFAGCFPSYKFVDHKTRIKPNSLDQIVYYTHYRSMI